MPCKRIEVTATDALRAIFHEFGTVGIPATASVTPKESSALNCEIVSQ